MVILKLLIFTSCFVFMFNNAFGSLTIPVLSLNNSSTNDNEIDTLKTKRETQFLRFGGIVEKSNDTSEYWRETEILSLVLGSDTKLNEVCERPNKSSVFHIPSTRTVRPICKRNDDFQICPQCSHVSNETMCELFRDSCKEKRVRPSEYRTYCDMKYGKWRTVFVPADYSQCRCCDECMFYRELDQSCVPDDNAFDTEEFLPVTTIDFRVGCNPYLGHPQQEQRALRCDKALRRCIPVSSPKIPNETLSIRRQFRYEPPIEGAECGVSCAGYQCQQYSVSEAQCPPGAFAPDRAQCNCCGNCSPYQQLDQKCAEYKKTVYKVNGTEQIEVEEEFLEPGCDDGLVCRKGKCQDIHLVVNRISDRMKRAKDNGEPREPCKKEMKLFKKKYGREGHLHYEAPQCTPLWLYAPVQCRRFVCYCALEDGTFIEGIKVPRVEVSNMNCDCAREKCRTGSDIECDGYGNYKEAVFTTQVESFNTDFVVDEQKGDDPNKRNTIKKSK